jgi:redoxin
MVLRAAVPVAAVLLAAASARAGSPLDRPAPDPVAAKWIVGEPPPAWKALKGRCALLEILDPDDLVCQGLVSRTGEIAPRAAERKLVVLSVAVGTGATEEKAREFAKSFKVTWPFALDRSGETFVAFGMPSLPRYFLIAPDGRVAWEGNPGTLDDRTLAGFLDRARLWRPEEVAKLLRPAAEAFVRGKYALAVKRVEEVLPEVKHRQEMKQPLDGTEEKDAAVITGAVKDIATIRLAAADRLAKDRWSLDALEILEDLARDFAGTEHEGKARERLKAIADDPRAQYEILATRRLREILGKLRPLNRRNAERAVEALAEFVKEFDNLQAAERAKIEKRRLEKLLEGL